MNITILHTHVPSLSDYGDSVGTEVQDNSIKALEYGLGRALLSLCEL